MDTGEVNRQWQELEREFAIVRCGADAAAQPREALEELAEQLRQQEGDDYTTKLAGFDAIGQRVAVGLARRYRLTVFRRKGQRRGTVMLMGPETFIDQVYWPLFERIEAVVWRQIDGWLHEALDASVRNWNASCPSSPRTYTPSRASVCAWGLRRRAESKRWMKVTAPVWTSCTERRPSKRLGADLGGVGELRRRPQGGAEPQHRPGGGHGHHPKPGGGLPDFEHAWTRGAVRWLLADGAFEYWRGEIVAARFS